MNLLIRLIYWIYSAVIYTGIKLSPPSILFHKPLPYTGIKYVEQIHVDMRFSPKEIELILESLHHLTKFTNSKVSFNLHIDLVPLQDVNYIENKLIKIHSSSDIIKNSDENIKGTTLGLCFHNTDGTKHIYLVYDRLKDDITFKCTTMHEYGHHIYLDHTEGKSIMNRHIDSNIMFPTRIDAIEYANKFECSPEDCMYLKI